MRLVLTILIRYRPDAKGSITIVRVLDIPKEVFSDNVRLELWIQERYSEEVHLREASGVFVLSCSVSIVA